MERAIIGNDGEYWFHDDPEWGEDMEREEAEGVLDIEKDAVGNHVCIHSVLDEDVSGHTDEIQDEESLPDDGLFIVTYFANDKPRGADLVQRVDFGITKQEIIKNVLAQKYREGAAYFLAQDLRKVPPAENEVPGSPKSYRCPFCGSERFIGHQIIRADVYVGGDGHFGGNLPGGLAAAIYDAGEPYGPFTCDWCGQEFDELPENRQIKLPRGTFTVVSGETVRKFKKAGYGYAHEDDGYTVISDGKSAVAVSDRDYDRYYGGQRSFLL